MKLLSEINEAADSLINTSKIITENIEFLLSDERFDIEQLDEAVQNFLTSAATKIEKGALKDNPKVKENIIDIFAALQALTQEDIAAAHDDNPKLPLGQVLDNFYGKNGAEAHKIAATRLKEIGRHPSSRSYRTQAEQAVNSPEHISAYANKIRTKIEPVMNRMLSKERQAAQARLDKQAEEKKQAEMGRPMVGAVPHRA